MTSRPEVLWPLFADTATLPGIGPKLARVLASAGWETPKDLALTLPASGIDRRLRDSVLDVDPPATATVEITVERHRPARQKGRPYRIDVSDARTAFQLVFFHAGGEWLTERLPPGSRRIVSGRLERFDDTLQMVHPDHILLPGEAGGMPAFEPVYPLTAGITQRVMSKAVRAATDLLPEFEEWADPELVRREGWSQFDKALRAAHAPERAADVSAEAPPRRRLAYDEFFAHQLTLALARAASRRKPGLASAATGRLQRPMFDALPYAPTKAQMRAIDEIAADMASPHRMNRLLQGDVGAGKTLVAMAALLVAVEAGGQGVLMAPTGILARQHLAGLAPLAEAAGVVMEILTGRDKGSERSAKLAALAAGDIQILVGTHAVFQKDVAFRDLRLAVIDEQHRFGVAERMELGRKGAATDVLVMTATPIPRSLSLAQYGHMDVSILDEKPPGRTPVTTALVSEGRMDEVLDHLRTALSEGRQGYWVCPLVGESEASDLAAAEDRFAALRAALGEGVVGLVHGQMPPAERDAAMARFQSGETKLLVATTVIEVGVDVPNASIMVVERAESFGLAQLHQLRGRVGRGAAASTCLLLYRPPLGETATRRLAILRETEDGFRISEEDLAIRGAGDMIGMAQSGLPRFRIADLERMPGLMAMAQTDARRLLAEDPRLESPRGRAARLLLWLLEQDRGIRMIGVG